MEEPRRWVPIESNPEVMEKYLEALGFPIGQYHVSDIVACEPWALEMIPGVVCGILLLYPITPVSEAAKQGQVATPSPNVFHMKQLVSNACGTIGLIHIAANLRENEVIGASVPMTGFFARFLEVTADMDSEQRGRVLVENRELFDEIKRAHHDAAAQGQTQARERVNTHFAAFVAKDGAVVELDGRKDGPINHGRYSSPESFAYEALQVIQREFISRDPTQHEFAILGLYLALE